MSENNPIFLIEGDSPDMLEAYKSAQQTFKFFWQEVFWENRRIIPAHDITAAKVAFENTSAGDKEPSAEFMWINQIDFDGHTVTGQLMNSPNWIKNLKEGDEVSLPLTDICDWLFSIYSKAYGGFTVNLMRSQMAEEERKEHDEAWGLDFGNPSTIDLMYDDSTAPEHPMSVNMGEKLQEELDSSDDILKFVDDRGWTVLHHEALAGNATSVEILLKNGADAAIKSYDGDLAVDLARLQGWQHVVDVFNKSS